MIFVISLILHFTLTTSDYVFKISDTSAGSLPVCDEVFEDLDLVGCARKCARDNTCVVFETNVEEGVEKCALLPADGFKSPLIKGTRGTITLLSADPELKTSNVALKKPASQIDVTHSGVAARGVDGRSSTTYGSGHCTHTSSRAGAWWYVNLGSLCAVISVTITNRQDCCQKRLSNFDVAVTTEIPTSHAFISEEHCAYHQATMPKVKTLTCPKPLIGQFVLIKHRTTEILTLCEVVVTGRCCSGKWK